MCRKPFFLISLLSRCKNSVHVPEAFRWKITVIPNKINHYHTFSYVLCIPLAMLLNSYTFPYVLHTCFSRSPKVLLWFFFQSYVSIRSAQPFRCFLIALYNCAHATYIYIYMYKYIYIYIYVYIYICIYIYIYIYILIMAIMMALCKTTLLPSAPRWGHCIRSHTFRIRSCERAVCVLEPM